MRRRPEADRGITRRDCARLLAAAMFARCGGASERLEWSAVPPTGPNLTGPSPTGLNLERLYRADAQVLLLGIPVLRREGVGGGSVRWCEFETGGTVRLLEFSGYSLPEHAAGLNRVGFIREMSRSPGAESAECLYFGLMTASPEESPEEARKALHTAAREQLYTAIEGRVSKAGAETEIVHFLAPATITGGHSAELVTHAREALQLGARTATQDATGAGLQPFLQTLAELLPHPDGRAGRYTYAGHSYRLQLTRAKDAKATEYFRTRKLIRDAVTVVRVSGRLRRESGGKETEFRLWLPDVGEKPMPLRIEYQAKSYLRLIFEVAGA